MDVFRFNEAEKKSVLAYPENCQSCGQCFFNCQGHALMIVNNTRGFAMTAYRATNTSKQTVTAPPV
jgi:MinD superfamily P-loop ATPase